MLQGFAPTLLQDEQDSLKVKAAGNAYPVPVVASLLQPLLREFSLQTPDGLPEGGLLDIETGRDAADRLKLAMSRFAQEAAATAAAAAEVRPAAEARPATASPEFEAGPAQPFQFMIGASDSE